ncbi:flagellar export chaperone FlgN [Desulfoplanes sp.]
MHAYIIQSLSRQVKGLVLLTTLLKRELQLLKEDSPQSVAGLEFSIQDLLRQIAAERSLVRRCIHGIDPGADRLSAITGTFGEEEQEILPQLIAEVDRLQQGCARNASMNAEIALALRDQSTSLLSFFRKQVTPKQQHTYSNHGTWASQTRTATLISGRL